MLVILYMLEKIVPFTLIDISSVILVFIFWLKVSTLLHISSAPVELLKAITKPSNVYSSINLNGIFYSVEATLLIPPNNVGT